MFGITKTINFIPCNRCGTEWTAESFSKDPETIKVCPTCINK